VAVESVCRDGSDGLELEEACLSLLATLPAMGQPTPESHTTRRHLEIVEQAKRVLLRRLGERLTLDDLARELGVSPFHLARLFRRRTGHSLHGYRTRMRLLNALDRLEESRGVLTDLALDLGFSSQSHFTDTFRRAFGVPPGTMARLSSPSRAAEAERLR
jgi:AraC-like DNA-binding protein